MVQVYAESVIILPKLSIKDKNVNKTKTLRKWKALNKVLLNLVRKST